MKTSTIMQAAAFAAFLALPALALRVDPNKYEGGWRANQEAVESRNRSAIGSVLGQLRTSMADVMFMKTELYLHNGVAFASHMNMKAMESTGEITGDNDAPTMIPDRDRDFRGIVGELERRVKPWQSADAPHVHTSGTELLPWYRLMTVSDPHNVRAYQIGAWWLKGSKPDEALAFVQEGILNNPRAFQLHYIKGQIYMEKAKRERSGTEAEAGGHAKTARLGYDSFVAAAELAITERPADYDPNGPDDPGRWWTHYTEEDARAAARMAILLARDFASPENGLKMARRYNEAFGGDGLLERYIGQLERKIAGEPAAADAP